MAKSKHKMRTRLVQVVVVGSFGCFDSNPLVGDRLLFINSKDVTKIISVREQVKYKKRNKNDKQYKKI